MTKRDTILRAHMAADFIVAKLTNPGVWCQGAWAEDNEGYATYANDPNAVKWCLTGFITRFTLDSDTLNLLQSETEKEIKARCKLGIGIPTYNDRWAKDQQDVSAVMSEVKQALFQKTFPFWHWYRWMPRSVR
jgi:hypothetical protein